MSIGQRKRRVSMRTRRLWGAFGLLLYCGALAAVPMCGFQPVLLLAMLVGFTLAAVVSP